MEKGNFYKLSSTSDDKMVAKRDYFCTQLIGVFWLILGLVGGILIGIFLYHGGPDAEVTCKNLPEPRKQESLTTVITTPSTTTTQQTSQKTEQQTTRQTTSVTTENASSQNFTYTIQNDWYEPNFIESIELAITTGLPLLSYMETACKTASNRFTNFSVTYYPSVPGFMVDTINGISGNWAANQTYWKISNQNGTLNVGVSQYVPTDGDEILFDLTQYVADPAHDN